MRQFAIFMVVLIFFLPLYLFAQDNKKDLSEEEKEKIKKIEAQKEKLTAGLFTPIVFYGKFVDQNGNPIANVGVVINTETYSPNPLLLFRANKVTELKSDDNGRFEYKGIGSKIIISYANVSLPTGYSVLPNNNDRFHYAQGLPGTQLVKLHTPDKDNPVVFTLRKKEKAEVITKISVWSNLHFAKKYYIDLLGKKPDTNNWLFKESDLSGSDSGLIRPQFTVEQKMLSDNDGVLIKETKFDFLNNIEFQLGKEEDKNLTAPESGYQKGQFKFTFKQIIENKKGFYYLKDDQWIFISNYSSGKPDSAFFWVKFPGNYYGKMIIESNFKMTTLDKEQSFEAPFNIRLELNTVAGNRIFEDDSDLRNEIGYQKALEIEGKVKNKLHSKFPLLKDVIEDEKAKTPEPTK